MATLTEKVRIVIETDTDGAKDLAGALKDVGSGAREAGAEGAQAGESIAGGFIKAQIIMEAAQAAMRLMVDLTKQAIGAAIEQENSEARLAQALGKRSDVLVQLANRMEMTTNFGDDEILAASARIAAYTKEEGAVKRLTEAATDLAQATGIDLEQAAHQLGSALGSNVDQLGRTRIAIEGAAGSAERLDSIIGGVADKFGGQAAAAAQTFEGRLKNTKESFDNVLESFGKAIITSPVLAELLATVTDTLGGMAEQADGTGGAVDTMREKVNGAVILAVKSLQVFSAAWDVVKAVVTTVVNGIVAIWTGAVGIIGKGIQTNIDNIVAFAEVASLLPGSVGNGFDIVASKARNLSREIGIIADTAGGMALGSLEGIGEAWGTIGESAANLDPLIMRLEAAQGATVELTTSTDASGNAAAEAAPKVEELAHAWRVFAEAPAEMVLTQAMKDDSAALDAWLVKRAEFNTQAAELILAGKTEEERIVIESAARLAEFEKLAREADLLGTEEYEAARLAIIQQNADEIAAIQERETAKASEEWQKRNSALIQFAGLMRAAMQQWVAGLVSGELSGKKAAKALAAAFLDSVAQMASTKATTNMMDGFTELGKYFASHGTDHNALAASGHFFAAAAGWTLLGGVAAGLSKKMMSDGKESGTSQEESGSAATSTAGGASSTAATTATASVAETGSTASKGESVTVNVGTVIGGSYEDVAERIMEVARRGRMPVYATEIV